MKNGVLRITTKLVKKGLRSDIAEMKAEVKAMSDDMGDVAEGAGGLASALGSSLASFTKIALIIGAIMLVLKTFTDVITNITKNNSEIAEKIERIKTALGNLWAGVINGLSGILLPIIEWILNSIYTLLGYVDAITKAWFGFSIFTQNATDNLEDANKQANKLKKTLAGFDTANILNKNETSGTGETKPEPITFPEVEIPEKLKKFIDFVKNFAVWFYQNVHKPLADFFNNLGGYWDQYVVQPISNLKTKLKPILDPIKEIIVAPFKGAYENIKTVIGNIGKTIQNIITIVKTVWEKLKPYIDKIKGLFEEVWKKLKEIFGSKIAQTIIDTFTGLFKKAFNGLMEKIENLMNVPLKAINKLIDKIQKIPGMGKLEKLDTFKLPRLAQGGIVNNPGKGVMMGSYIAGEKGAEAVIPLTDDTLQRLANMIPITIDLTNKLDSRIIGKQIVEVSNNKQFARNGG